MCLRKTNYPDSLQYTLAPSPVCILPTRKAALVLASGHNFLNFCLCIITGIATPTSLVAILFKYHFRFFLFYAYNCKTCSEILCKKKYAGCQMYQEGGDTFDSKRRKYKPPTTTKVISYSLLAICSGFRNLHHQAIEMHEER
jgi:hypothetical protein